MSERRFVIYEAKDNEELYLPTIRESEFHRRIDLAFRLAFCTLDEKFDYDKAVEIIVHGEGENQHDLSGCEDEAGPNWNGEGKNGEDPLVDGMVRVAIDAMQHRESGKESPRLDGIRNYLDKSSPAPTREEWEKWAYKTAGVIWNEDGADAIIDALLSMPIIPK